jgi:hypothetical protein
LRSAPSTVYQTASAPDGLSLYHHHYTHSLRYVRATATQHPDLCHPGEIYIIIIMIGWRVTRNLSFVSRSRTPRYSTMYNNIIVPRPMLITRPHTHTHTLMLFALPLHSAARTPLHNSLSPHNIKLESLKHTTVYKGITIDECCRRPSPARVE